jgi:hypothetical protein
MEVELLDRRAACEFFGGSRPLNSATLFAEFAGGATPDR